MQEFSSRVELHAAIEVAANEMALAGAFEAWVLSDHRGPIDQAEAQNDQLARLASKLFDTDQLQVRIHDLRPRVTL